MSASRLHQGRPAASIHRRSKTLANIAAAKQDSTVSRLVGQSKSADRFYFVGGRRSAHGKRHRESDGNRSTIGRNALPRRIRLHHDQRGSIENMSLPLAACVTGFVLAAVGAILQEKLRKQAWISVNAECLDFEIQLGSTAQGGQLWALRALCRFELDGTAILTCTPETTWPKSQGEGWMESFISKQATCTLLVNPHRPREVEPSDSSKECPALRRCFRTGQTKSAP